MAWYVSRDDGVSGPYTKAEVVKRIADGNIGRDVKVRKEPAVEWCPIEESTFAAAFNASNPYRNPESSVPKQPFWRSPWVWLGVPTVVICVAGSVGAIRAGADPGGTGEIFGEFLGRVLLGAFLVWGLGWGLARSKTKRR